MRVAGGLAAGVAVAAMSLAVAAPVAAVTLEPIGTYSAPVFVTSDPDDPDRIFVVEQGGRIMLTAGGQTTTFLDLTTVDPPIVQSGGERGLLSMALSPDYRTSGRFYVFYTGTDGGTLHVDELTSSGLTADPATRQTVITVPHPTFGNHNGGQLQFGPDGYLYMSTGDGGGGGDPGENAQNTDSLLGKILRIDPIPGGGYAVPPDNPFVGAEGADEVWSYGLRNPWRFSFDRATGDLTIADVGQASWEEIDYDPVAGGAGRGDNFGWDCREGRHDFETAGCSGLTFTEPIFEYANDSGTCSITGGYVVRDPGLSELRGRYVYADLCAGQLHSLVPAVPDALDVRSEGLTVTQPSSFGEDACGRVYVASLSGPVYRLVDSTPTECPVHTSQPAQDTAGPGLRLDGKRRQGIKDRRFSVKATVDEPATVELSGAVVVRKRGRELFELAQETEELAPGATERIAWKLSRKEARRVERKLGRGKRIEATVGGVAVDGAGNQGADARLEIRLNLR
jgi:hypothetical protein